MRAPHHSSYQPDLDPDLEQIVEKVSTEHGFDVRGYKRSTLYRRIRKRMLDAGCERATDYLARLESEPSEFGALFDTILINVTSFFRDPDAWDLLQGQCLAELAVRRESGEPIRAWSVGCATGEEAYSLAIALAEALDSKPPRYIRVYATDVDEPALSFARSATYPVEALASVSSERRTRFFDELPGDRFGIKRDLRASVVFGRHNALVDPPISRLDLVVCRNLLIYFDTQTQDQLLGRFHYALKDQGVLFLGKAETLMSRAALFISTEPRHRIFRRVPRVETAPEMASSNASLRVDVPIASSPWGAAPTNPGLPPVGNDT